MDWLKTTLTAYDWDGVNIAELNFDADFKDYLLPERFVPMNSDVRNDFRKKAGFDPIQLFQPGSPNYHKENPAALQKFLRYREGIVTDWHKRLLAELEPLHKQRGWEIILTVQDSLHSK